METKPTVQNDPVAEIAKLHSEIHLAAQKTLACAIRIGELLSGVKSNLEHGKWLPWLEANVPFSERAAQYYMRFWERRNELKSANVADLSSAYRLLNFSESEVADAVRLTEKLKVLVPKLEPSRRALQELRNKQLYKIDGYETFAEYWVEKLGWKPWMLEVFDEAGFLYDPEGLESGITEAQA